MQWVLRQRLLQAAAIICLLIAAGPLWAQVSTGAISGTVTDPTGAAVEGATVTITSQDTGVSRKLATDASGFYSAEGLSVGQYTIDVSRPGFKESVTKGIQIDPGQRRSNKVMLQVGNTTSQVTVTADAQQVNTQTSESGGTITSKQISNLMLNGRNFQTLAISVPGVSSTSGADALNGGGLEGGTTLIVNGQSVEYTTYTIDGVYNMNSGNLANVNILPIVDGISEFRVLKDNYSARYGFAGSGQIVVETKSGTDTFHGSAWDYLRNNAFDANNYYSTTTQALHQNIFGYTLGGPLIIPKIYNTDRSKKTFFFASNQWYVINSGQVSRGAVFSQALRNGDFSASPTLGSGGLKLDAHSQALLASEGKANCVTSATTLNPACFDPVAVSVMNAYVPLPNNPSGGFLNYINQGALTTSQLDYQFRVDHYINANNQVMARIMYEPVKNGFPFDNWGGLPYSTITDSFYTTSFNGLVRVTSSITPNVLNTVGIAETYDKPRINTTSGGTMPSGATVKQAFPGADIYNRIPNISISGGWSGNGVQSEPITASDGEGTISDDVSWVKGSHVIQAGALYIFGIKRQNVFTNPQGSFTFSGVHTGDPAADYLLGLDATYSQASSQKLGNFHYREGEAYLQDDWKATRRLSLNLGLRWVYFSNDTASGDQVTSFSPAAYDPATAPVVNIDGSLQINGANQPVNSAGQPANLLNGLLFAGKNGVPSGFFTPVKTNFGPRVGFAYDVFGDGRTSIRGGYGIGFSRIPLEVIYAAFGQNPPFNNSANILNSTLTNASAGAVAAPTTQTLSDVPLKFKPASIQSYSLTVEQQIKNNLIASVAYVGSLGRNLETFQGGYDANSPLPVSAPSTAGCLPNGQAPSTSYNFDPCINSGVASRDYTRPYKGYSAMNDEYYHGSSNYNSLQSSLSYRAGASQFSLAYTYSKALATIGGHGTGGTTSQGAAAQNMRDFHAEYGPPDYDFTNDITATWVYSIPYFKDSSKPVTMALGNWSFAGLALHQSGFALSPGMATSTAGLATRPDVVAPYHQVGKLDQWFDPAAFQAPAYGFYGDARNGMIRGPGYTSVNLSLYKTFPIKGRLNTEFRAEAFNVANHPNFKGVSTSLGSGNFSQVTSAGDPRILEFALKLLF
ncbi:TonB-dependent receptor [Acidipila rosea]|uniref:TonB-dependent receptor-like protein n=1 Tax=Acidipila rosea TaxID=768535 RepID=A0A4R1L446_9BACT|nr:carboxypeptidase regulatory-like domain-containing protein [Acidipila rosea]TCK71733.1 TonB-dependent receptor-like protein [Acidipila rosea]